jgi:hypothetical protein
MVLIVFMPGFGIHDCTLYYRLLLQHLGSHTVRFAHIDGYTYSGCRYLGDVHLSTVLGECADMCNKLTEPYVLMGHSSGAILAGHLYPLLIKKPLDMLLLNPMTRVPRIRVIREWVPLPVSLMWLTDWVPFSLYVNLYKAKVFGSDHDITTMLKFRLWRDLVIVIRKPLQAVLPITAKIVTSTRDSLGCGLGTIQYCNHYEFTYPGHASFRSMACITTITGILANKVTNHNLFQDIYKDS